MSFTTRSLLGRVSKFRSDLPDSGVTEYFLQEAARRVMQDTFLGQIVQRTFFLPRRVDTILFTANIPWWDVTNAQPNMAYVPNTNTYLTGTNSLGLDPNMMFLPACDDYSTATSGQLDPVDILRFTNLKIANAAISPSPGTGNFRGYFKAIPSTTGWTMGDFIILMVGGSITQSSITSYWNGDDVAYWNNATSMWTFLPANQFINLAQQSAGNAEHSPSAPVILPPQSNPSNTYPAFWTQRSGRMAYLQSGANLYTGFTGMQIKLYNASSYDTAFQVQYSCIPNGDIGNMELNLPDEARDAIVDLCLSDILSLPGTGQNLILSENKRVTYEQVKSKLAALGVMGMGGSTTFHSPNFGSRTGRSSPYWFSNSLPGW